MAELEERLSTIYAARYRHELAAALADLPPAATPTAGWAVVLTLAWRQLITDLAGLFGRGRTTLSRRRRLGLALVLLAVAAVAITFVVLLIHGMVDDGPEGADHHGLGDHEFGGD
jgi:type VI protein secretion system component VasK